MIDSKAIDDLLKHYTEVGPKGCGAVVMQHGEVIYEGYAGFADEEKQIPVDRNTYFRYYSCSKVFTVVALMQLYEKGLFLLNDPIEKYLPEFSDPQVYVTSGNGVVRAVRADRSITIRDLLSMRSGLTSEGIGNPTDLAIRELSCRWSTRKSYTCREHVKALAEIPLAFHPGTRFYYGYSIDVIGALIEVLSGKTLGEYLKENILEPLDLKHTCFFREDITEGTLAACYTWDENHKLVPTDAYDWQFAKEHKWESGGSGILSTVADVARFGSALSMGGVWNGTQIIGSKTIDLIRTNQLEGQPMKDFEKTWDNGWDFLRGYGYGLGVRTFMNPAAGGLNANIGEFGWAGMAGTHILADPKEEISMSYAHQIVPNNMEGYCHPRLKQVIYAALD